jgi:hypothetical protein
MSLKKLSNEKKDCRTIIASEKSNSYVEEKKNNESQQYAFERFVMSECVAHVSKSN